MSRRESIALLQISQVRLLERMMQYESAARDFLMVDVSQFSVPINLGNSGDHLYNAIG
jgi:hypothetical protein